MNYIEKLQLPHILGLIEEMKISRDENIHDITSSIHRCKLHTYHGKLKDNTQLECIYTEFEIEKLYNTKPSKYDQRRFQNYMISIFGRKYKSDLKAYLLSKEEDDESERE